MTRFVVVVDADPVADGLHARVRLGAGTRNNVRRASDVIDEHFVVDVDVCREGRLLDCADVLQSGRPHRVVDAVRRLTDLTSAHPACGIAAVPLAGTGGDPDGWAAVGGSDRAVVLLPHPPHSAHPPLSPHSADGQWPLLPSCLHAWLVAGRSLREWPYARSAPSG